MLDALATFVVWVRPELVGAQSALSPLRSETLTRINSSLSPMNLKRCFGCERNYVPQHDMYYSYNLSVNAID